jgi:subtilase-type serine protease
VKVAISDGLGAGFQMPGQALVATTAPQPLSAGLLSRTIRSDLRQSRTAAPEPITASFSEYPGQTLDLTGGDDGLSASLLLPASGSGAGVTLTRSITDGDTRLDVGLKLARDAGAVIGFGDAGNGAPGTDLVSLRLGLSQDFTGGGYLSVGGEMGVADIGTPAMLTDVSSAKFDSVGFEIGQRGAFGQGDRLSLGVALPVAVTSGSAKILLPVAMAAGTSQLQDVGIDLAPSDRQMDLTLAYQTPLGDGQELMFKLVHAQNYGNRAGIGDTAAVIAYRFEF